MDSILRPLGAIIGGIMALWGWTVRRGELNAIIVSIIPTSLGGGPLTAATLARRVAADRAWPYGPIPHFALSRALDELIAAGRVVGPLDDEAGGSYALASREEPG